ncbi:MAG: hypothetical protein C3F07_05900 [Anaerolineales bacterium]|nr:hypothetical protein [Anaerolineae bacterium]PWB75263.1 MAG: hypothetical protein C3F07_05900 [Anaerolineales bacterium]
MLDAKDIITIILALYGAVLSSVLAIREIKKEKRTIALFIDFYVWESSFKLTVVNIGHRPVTLAGAGIMYFKKYRMRWFELDERPFDLARENPGKFPLTLNDGNHVALAIPSVVDALEWTNGLNKGEAYVRDVEGNIYKTSRIRRYNSKADAYE